MSWLPYLWDGVHLSFVLVAAVLGGMTTWVSMKMNLAQMRRDMDQLSREINEHQKDSLQHIHREALEAKLDRLHDGLQALREECREIRQTLAEK